MSRIPVGTSSADTAIASSSVPYTRTGRLKRGAMRAAAADPSASPPMYAASTAATASSEVPNTNESSRAQAVWYRSAANPDSAKQARSGANRVSMLCRSPRKGPRI
jgi:hypothetical protein